MGHSATVKREIACQRRHFRISAPISIRFSDTQKTFKTDNWSMGGFCLRDINTQCAENTLLKATVLVAFGEFHIDFETEIRVVRSDPENKILAAEFVDLSPAHKELLKHFSDALVTGQMTSVEDTIQRMDVPVSLVSEKPDKPKTATVDNGKSKSRKTLMVSGFYVLLGVGVATYALNTLYTNVFKLEVDSATIVGNENLIRSPISGTIDKVYVDVGDQVDRASALLYVRDDSTLESIDLARLQVNEAESDLQQKQQLLTSQLEKMQTYKQFGSDVLRMREARTQSLREKLALAEKRYARTEKLAAQNLYSDDLLDRIAEEVITLKSDLKVALAEQNIAENAIAEIDNGRYFTDNRLEGQVDELKTAVEAAQARVALEKQRLTIMENRRARLEVSAPVDATVASLFTAEHQLIEKGQPLLVLEREGEKSVDAFVSAKDFEKVSIDKPVKVILAGKSKTLDAFITRVDRNPVTDASIAGELHAEGDFTPPVKVSLRFAENYKDTRNIPSGLPVKLLFSRQSLNQTLASVKGFFVEQAVAEDL